MLDVLLLEVELVLELRGADPVAVEVDHLGLTLPQLVLHVGELPLGLLELDVATVKILQLHLQPDIGHAIGSQQYIYKYIYIPESAYEAVKAPLNKTVSRGVEAT